MQVFVLCAEGEAGEGGTHDEERTLESLASSKDKFVMDLTSSPQSNTALLESVGESLLLLCQPFFSLFK